MVWCNRIYCFHCSIEGTPEFPRYNKSNWLVTRNYWMACFHIEVYFVYYVFGKLYCNGILWCITTENRPNIVVSDEYSVVSLRCNRVASVVVDRTVPLVVVRCAHTSIPFLYHRSYISVILMYFRKQLKARKERGNVLMNAGVRAIMEYCIWNKINVWYVIQA